MQHGHSAQHRLYDDRSQRAERQGLHPATPVGKPRPQRDCGRQNNREPGNHAMAVLVANAANPWWKPENVPV